MSKPRITVVIQELKAIRSLRWEPNGVSVLVGPNGSGKSTALRVFDVLRLAIEEGLPLAFDLLGGGPIRNLDAGTDAVPRIIATADDAEWVVPVEPRSPARDLARSSSAEIFRGSNPSQLEMRGHGVGVSVVHANAHDSVLSAVRRIADPPASLFALSESLAKSRYFHRPELGFLRENASAEGPDTCLSSDAKNLFTVLKNWTLDGDYSERREFVLRSMEELFPSSFRRLDFSQAGSRTSASVLSRLGKERLLPTDWSDGFFCCLAMLTGLASVQGGVCAIDEPENSLHPELIRRMLELMREWSRKHETTVILATHSPVVLNEFREEPEKVFVMQPGRAQLPVRLDELKKREWLEHFALGDLYVQNEVGAPTQQ